VITVTAAKSQPNFQDCEISQGLLTYTEKTTDQDTTDHTDLKCSRNDMKDDGR
jgi:hypothetical protein